MNLGRVRMIDAVRTRRWGLHIVQRRTDVSHETHEEERRLKDRVFNEIQAVNNLIVPSRALQICKQAEEGD